MTCAESDNSISTSRTTLLVIVPNTLCIRAAACIYACTEQACPDTYSCVHTVRRYHVQRSGTKAAAFAGFGVAKRYARPRAGLRSFAIIAGKTGTIARNACVYYMLALTRGCTGNYAVRPCMEIAYEGT